MMECDLLPTFSGTTRPFTYSQCSNSGLWRYSSSVTCFTGVEVLMTGSVSWLVTHETGSSRSTTRSHRPPDECLRWRLFARGPAQVLYFRTTVGRGVSGAGVVPRPYAPAARICGRDSRVRPPGDRLLGHARHRCDPDRGAGDGRAGAHRRADSVGAEGSRRGLLDGDYRDVLSRCLGGQSSG